MAGIIDDLTLRALPTGSLAALFVLHSMGTLPVTTRLQLTWPDQYVSSNLDGLTDLRTVFTRDAVGIGLFDPQNIRIPTPTPTTNIVEGDVADVPDLLRRQTGLPVETLAKAMGVSKVTYHKWINGAGISEESRERLLQMRELFKVLVVMRPNLRAFLNTLTPVGSPLELLSQRKDSLALGLASRGDTLLADAPAPSTEGVRRVRPIGWARSVDRNRLEDFGSTAVPRDEAIDVHEEGEPLSVGFVLFRA